MWIYFRNFVIISQLYPLGKRRGPSFEQIWIPFTQKDLCQVLLKLAQWFWRKWFHILINKFLLIHSSLPLEKGGTLHLNKHESPSPNNDLSKFWLKLAQWFWRRIFLKFFNVFSLFRNYLPLEMGVKFIFKNLNPHQARMLCAKFGWNWPSGSWEEDENVKSLQTDGRDPNI